MLVESKLKDEQGRRAFLEQLLPDVYRDLDSEEILVPATMKALTKLADVQTRRLKMLLEEHRIELGRDRPVQMFVAHADTVTVRGGG